MRARNIKPGFFKNDLLGEVDPLARLLYIGLWCLADREGRLADRPRKIRAEILPYDDCEVEGLLEELHRLGFIRRYAVDGEWYIWIPAFRAHQNPHPREAASVIPPPEGASGRGISTAGPADSLNPEPGIPDPDDDRRPDRSGGGGDHGVVVAGTNEAGTGAADWASAVADLEAHFLAAGGKRTANARDLAAIRQALALAGGDAGLVRSVMDEAFRLFKPKFAADRIVSFAYFLPVLEHHLQRRAEAAAAGAGASGGAAEPEFDPEARAALTAELLRLLEEFPGGAEVAENG
ncbi:hypothetical protein EDC14_1001161 [Hydrogenispora ethanolica]|uniref:Uncharacterized protein n=1 Tax=Hydrogenispora ethanolica TaxID=1082276 RepID=A0A4R1SBF0_HYDET|nr:hypothetical protein [Hydrogenispora ethanolica]TCL76876.1 hypothetical protein EDC14_1001161 [Hydrogenispora ethanolica]